MERRPLLPVLLSVAVLVPLLSGWAEEHEQPHEQHDQQHDQQRGAHRAPPPKFQAHAPGVHPHGATVRSHQVRVLAPRVVTYGHHEWTHWSHPEFACPVYNWEWASIHSVNCTAEDSYGDQYPVTESWAPGPGP